MELADHCRRQPLLRLPDKKTGSCEQTDDLLTYLLT